MGIVYPLAIYRRIPLKKVSAVRALISQGKDTRHGIVSEIALVQCPSTVLAVIPTG